MRILALLYSKIRDPNFKGFELTEKQINDFTKSAFKYIPVKLEHENFIIGRIVRFYKENMALKCEILIDENTKNGKYAAAQVRNGKLWAVSLGMTHYKNNKSGAIIIKQINEVSLTNDPDYPDTIIEKIIEDDEINFSEKTKQSMYNKNPIIKILKNTYTNFSDLNKMESVEESFNTINEYIKTTPKGDIVDRFNRFLLLEQEAEENEKKKRDEYNKVYDDPNFKNVADEIFNDSDSKKVIEKIYNMRNDPKTNYSSHSFSYDEVSAVISASSSSSRRGSRLSTMDTPSSLLSGLKKPNQNAQIPAQKFQKTEEQMPQNLVPVNPGMSRLFAYKQ